jgi:hypothetical protein
MTMAWIAVGTAVATAAYGGYQANQAAKKQAGQSRLAGASAISEGAMNEALNNVEAQDVELAARQQADQIKRQSLLMRGTIVVAQSGSGVMIGEGSAQAALDQLDMLSSADALAALYSGVNAAASKRMDGRLGIRAAQNKAEAFGAQAGSQLAAGNAAMIGGLLSAGSALAGGYAKNTAPAPKG